MEARLAGVAIVVASLASLGASYQTANFDVNAPTPEMAQQIGEAAERYRHDLAVEWTGKAMPNWSRRCPIQARVAPQLGAGGETSFFFERGEVFGWRMQIQGSFERILDSVLPHEITHTIFACHFRRGLPRWADEGACTSVEHASERAKQQRMLVEILKTGRGISFSQMFMMKDYPQDILPLYSQGYSLARYLLAQGGKQEFLGFIGDGMRTEDWQGAVTRHYGYSDLLALQNAWLTWVRQGSPPIGPDPRGVGDGPLVAATGPRKRPQPNLIYRAQSADPPAGDAEGLVPVDIATEATGRSEPGSQAVADPRPVPFPPPRPGNSPYPRDVAEAAEPGAVTEPITPAQVTASPAETPPASHQASTAGDQAASPQAAAEPGWQMVLEWRRPAHQSRPARPLTMADRPAGHALVKK